MELRIYGHKMIIVEDLTPLFNLVAWNKLRQQIREIEKKFPKTVPLDVGSVDVGMQIAGWGGWSLTSSDGNYTDGWQLGHLSMVQTADGTVKKLFPFANSRDFSKYTEIATPHLKFCVERARALGFLPCRARILQMMPGDQSDWHIDNLPESKAVRLHFVIETNPDAVLITEDGTHHLEQDHVYMFNINAYHQVKNLGTTIRTHLFMDVTDTRGITKHHSRLDHARLDLTP
jgi:Aspartyl/Asparaginyl beta-hydroxylase